MKTETMTMMRSPIGLLRLVACGEALVEIHLEDDAPEGPHDARSHDAHPVLAEARRQLEAYFAGTRRDFALPLAPAGTPFERSVWQALLAIPHGETTSYGAIAAALGRPTAARAVGAANGKNPLAIVVPCHRVIGASGALTGYAGGLPRKRWLLDHEQQHR